MPTRIAIDCRSLQDASRLRGIGNVVKHLLPELAPLLPTMVILSTAEGPDIDTPLPVLRWPKTEDLETFLRRNSVCHLHFMAQYNVPADFTFPHSVTVHDLFNWHRWVNPKKDWATQQALVSRLRNANFLFTVSEFTKSELVTRHGVSPELIHVTYPGQNTHLQAENRPDRPSPFPFPYILSIGNFEPRKNLSNMIKAVLLANKSRSEKLHFVAVQSRGNIIQLAIHWLQIAWAGQSRYFHFLGWVSDELLTDLYQNTRLFCFVSRAEGFGLPLLEAMPFDIPILTSTRTALPEVGQNGVAYADPESITDIATQIGQLLDHPAISPDLRAKRQATLAQFTYARMAQEMLRIFNQNAV